MEARRLLIFSFGLLGLLFVEHTAGSYCSSFIGQSLSRVVNYFLKVSLGTERSLVIGTVANRAAHGATMSTWKQAPNLLSLAEKDDGHLRDDENAKCAKDGGPAHTCSKQTPWKKNDNLSYGFAAARLIGQGNAKKIMLLLLRAHLYIWSCER